MSCMGSNINSTSDFITRGKALLINVEQAKKDEWLRRRRIRLQQVRQQSKQIANELREKVRIEKGSISSKNDKQNSKQFDEWKKRQIKCLQTDLDKSVLLIGKAHDNALQEIEVNAISKEKQNIMSELSKARCDLAIQKEKREQFVRSKQKEDVLKRKEFTRSIENLRSALVSTLPPPIIKPKPPPPKKTPKKVKISVPKKKVAERTEPEWFQDVDESNFLPGAVEPVPSFSVCDERSPPRVMVLHHARSPTRCRSPECDIPTKGSHTRSPTRCRSSECETPTKGRVHFKQLTPPLQQQIRKSRARHLSDCDNGSDVSFESDITWPPGTSRQQHITSPEKHRNHISCEDLHRHREHNIITIPSQMKKFDEGYEEEVAAMQARALKKHEEELRQRRGNRAEYKQRLQSEFSCMLRDLAAIDRTQRLAAVENNALKALVPKAKKCEGPSVKEVSPCRRRDEFEVLQEADLKDKCHCVHENIVEEITRECTEAHEEFLEPVCQDHLEVLDELLVKLQKERDCILACYQGANTEPPQQTGNPLPGTSAQQSVATSQAKSPQKSKNSKSITFSSAEKCDTKTKVDFRNKSLPKDQSQHVGENMPAYTSEKGSNCKARSPQPSGAPLTPVSVDKNSDNAEASEKINEDVSVPHSPCSGRSTPIRSPNKAGKCIMNPDKSIDIQKNEHGLKPPLEVLGSEGSFEEFPVKETATAASPSIPSQSPSKRKRKFLDDLEKVKKSNSASQTSPVSCKEVRPKSVTDTSENSCDRSTINSSESNVVDAMSYSFDGVKVVVKVSSTSAKVSSVKTKKPLEIQKSREADLPSRTENQKLTFNSNNSNTTSGTSYMSPPSELDPEQQQILSDILNKIEAKNKNPLLHQYIVKLLGMSRKSIDDLGISVSDVSIPSDLIGLDGQIQMHGKKADNDFQPSYLSAESSSDEIIAPKKSCKKVILESDSFDEDIEDPRKIDKESDLRRGTSGKRGLEPTDVQVPDDSFDGKACEEMANLFNARLKNLVEMIENFQVPERKQKTCSGNDDTSYMSPPSSIQSSVRISESVKETARSRMLPRTEETVSTGSRNEVSGLNPSDIASWGLSMNILPKPNMQPNEVQPRRPRPPSSLNNDSQRFVLPGSVVAHELSTIAEVDSMQMSQSHQVASRSAAFSHRDRIDTRGNLQQERETAKSVVCPAPSEEVFQQSISNPSSDNSFISSTSISPVKTDVRLRNLSADKCASDGVYDESSLSLLSITNNSLTTSGLHHRPSPPTTSEDLEEVFRSLGIGWALSTLRKNNEAKKLEESSSSNENESKRRNRRYKHSTPKKNGQPTFTPTICNEISSVNSTDSLSTPSLSLNTRYLNLININEQKDSNFSNKSNSF